MRKKARVCVNQIRVVVFFQVVQNWKSIEVCRFSRIYPQPFKLWRINFLHKICIQTATKFWPYLQAESLLLWQQGSLHAGCGLKPIPLLFSPSGRFFNVHCVIFSRWPENGCAESGWWRRKRGKLWIILNCLFQESCWAEKELILSKLTERRNRTCSASGFGDYGSRGGDGKAIKIALMGMMIF